MNKLFVLFVSSFAFICLTESAPPSFIPAICKSADTECIKKSAKAVIPIFAKGLPDHKVPSIDPITYKTINASQGDLLFVLTDVTAAGLGNCQPVKIERDVAKSKLYVNLLCTGTLDGQYEMRGQLLLFPIEGQGGIHVKLRSVLVMIDADMEEKDGKDGKKHWHIKSWAYSFDLKEKADVVFENLYKDNKVLAQAARDLVANNGNEIVKEIGPPVMKAMVGTAIKHINYLFKSIAVENLSLD